MDTLRFLGLAALMFAATFLGMNWYLRVEPPKPDQHAATPQHVDTNSAADKLSITPKRSATIRAIRR
jgi:hypothetical protein